jgi:SPFH domain / Band 7 family
MTPAFRRIPVTELFQGSSMLEFLQAITGIFVVVYDGQHALKFQLGRAVAVVGPGVHFKFPIIQRFKVEPTKDTTLDLEPQVIQLSDELVYEVGAKVVYQIVDLRKAVVEVDNLVEGLKNRLVIIVQNVVKAQDRYSIRDMARMVEEVKKALGPIEQQWGVKVHEFGFSTFTPTPETLEITQLQKLANEKLTLYRRFHDDENLSTEAAVSLISGAVMALAGHRAMMPEQAMQVPDAESKSVGSDGRTTATGDSTSDVTE